MFLQIASHDEFSQLLDGLGKDVVDAAIHLRLHADIRAAIPEYHRELNESRAFWTLTLDAHWRVALSCLIRAYDQNAASLCLVNLIDTITGSPLLAELRLASAPSVGSDALMMDRTAVTPTDDLVKRLVALRGNVLAHRNAANVLDRLELEKRFGLTLEEA